MSAERDAVYDSAEPQVPFVSEWRAFRRYRGLIRLLVVRDLTVRYKRSLLGVSWTLLNPLLTTAVMWVVFSRVFRFQIPDPVPFIVYLLSGVLLATYFAQGVLAAGSSIVNSATILTKVYVPGEVFAVAAATSAATNFTISLVPLLLVQVATGVGVPWTFLLVPIPILAMLALVTGLGLLIAAAAVFFRDVLDLAGVGVQLLGYLTPTFYPVTIVPDRLRILIEANPVYAYLLTFRHLAYLGTIPPWYVWAAMLGTALTALALGVWVFSRSWPRMAVRL